MLPGSTHLLFFHPYSLSYFCGIGEPFGVRRTIRIQIEKGLGQHSTFLCCAHDKFIGNFNLCTMNTEISERESFIVYLIANKGWRAYFVLRCCLCLANFLSVAIRN